MVQKLKEGIFLIYLTHTTQTKGQIRGKQNVLAFVHIYYAGLESWLSNWRERRVKGWALTLEVKVTPGETVLVVQSVKRLLRHPWVWGCSHSPKPLLLLPWLLPPSSLAIRRGCTLPSELSEPPPSLSPRLTSVAQSGEAGRQQRAISPPGFDSRSKKRANGAPGSDSRWKRGLCPPFEDGKMGQFIKGN